MAKRIMHKFRMEEISAVNSPAQKPARSFIMKRDQNCQPDDDDGEGNNAGKDGKSKKEKTMDLEKKVADLESQVADLNKQVGTLTTEKTALTKAAADAQAEAEALKKAAEIAKSDETFEAEGTTIRKSEVGEGTFKVLKAQQERIEVNAFEKAAQAEVPFLPGEITMKARVLRGISKLPEDISKAAMEMLKAGSAALKGLTKSVGVDGEREIKKADDELDTLAKNYAKENKVSYAVAYDAVLATDEGKALYKRSLEEK